MLIAWLPIIAAASAGLNYLSNRRDQNQSRELSERDIALMERMYNDRSPLRARADQALSRPLPGRPDLSSDFADPSNPFYSAPKALGFGGGTGGGMGPAPSNPLAGQPSTPAPPGPDMLPPHKRRGGGIGIANAPDREDDRGMIYF